MERGAAAGTLLAALMALGAPLAAGTELSGVFQEMVKSECHFINGTERVRFVKRFIYNREQYVHFDSDVGHFVGDTPYGEEVARYWNSDPEWMEHRRDAVDRHCRHNYELSTPFLVERRVPPSVSISLVPPSSSQPGPGQQELSEHVVATDVVPNGDWTHQLLVLLETPPRRGLSYSCQVEHVSLEQPLRRHWEMPPDAARSKMLTGIGGFVLGLVFLALGLGFSLCRKFPVCSTRSRGGSQHHQCHQQGPSCRPSPHGRGRAGSSSPKAAALRWERQSGAVWSAGASAVPGQGRAPSQPPPPCGDSSGPPGALHVFPSQIPWQGALGWGPQLEPRLSAAGLRDTASTERSAGLGAA
ncbi:class II histocompatibility antigen, B-L beta chain-like [Passerculus sandwichensis]